ncbi:ORF3 [torque teno Delphinidae virus 1]
MRLYRRSKKKREFLLHRARNELAGKRNALTAPEPPEGQKGQAPGSSSSPSTSSGFPRRWGRVLLTVYTQMEASFHGNTAPPPPTGAKAAAKRAATPTKRIFRSEIAEKAVQKLWGSLIRQFPRPLNPSPIPPITAFDFKL